MKKFLALSILLASVIFPSVSFGASSNITLYVTGTEKIAEPTVTTEYQEAQYDEEGNETQAEVMGVVTFPAPSDSKNYTFETVQTALEFARNPQVYISNNYTGYIDESIYTIEYDSSLQSTISTVGISIETASNELPETVDLTAYAAITTITFTALPRIITAPYGERHFITGDQSVTFSNITFNGNYGGGTTADGGGVTVTGGAATFTGCVFTRCYTSTNGGGVLVSGGDASFSGTQFNSCEADGSGGGIYVSGTGTVNLAGVTFNSCNADNSGGGFAASGGTVTISGSSFLTCTAVNSGGGLSATGGSVTVSGSSFRTCRAENDSGVSSGGAAAVTGGSLTLSGTSFTNNQATNGGAVYSSSGLTVGDGVTFNTITAASPNIAVRGGALYVASGTANITGSPVGFTENTADYGGAIFTAAGTVNISGTGITFAENVVSYDGGAIFANAGSRINIAGDNFGATGNNAGTGSGGFIYASGDRTAVTITSAASEFSGNAAVSGDGGAILAGGGAVLSISGAASFANNTADYGGAVYLSATRRNQTALSITGSSEANFTGNIANTSGGGIYAETNSKMTFAPAVNFTNNTASNGDGGALWVSEALQLPDGTVTFTDNTASKSDSTSTTEGSGGAVYIGGSSATAVTLGSTKIYTFRGNDAKSYGGAICTLSADVVFDGYTVTEQNKSSLGGGYAASYSGKITLRNSSFSNQTTEGSGGAVWAANIEAVSCDFGSDGANISTGTDNHQGGGALYSTGELTLTQSTFTENTASNGGGAAYSYVGDMTVTDSIFTGNTAIQGGGALYAEASQVSITNSYFATNSTASGNGGAVNLQGNCTSSITSSTMRNNTSSKLDGGAIYAQGTLNIQLCYLRENRSQRSGGGIYFNQNSDNPNEYSLFRMTSTMLEQNSTMGTEGNGGGLYVVANNAVLDKCTFNGNRLVLAGNSGQGGGAYVSAYPIQDEDVEIVNCTFYDNHIDDGAQSGTGGGGLAVLCEKTTRVTSCTFVMNGSQYNGGAIYVADGSKLQLLATLTVGNTDDGTYDIWSDGTILSGGYNRIGVYGKGTGVTDFYSETRNDTDRTAYPSKGWAKSTFFGNNMLDVNDVNDAPEPRTDLQSGYYPPYIGSTLSSRTRLLTVALSEDAALPLVDRATNIIPYSRRGILPTTDARGVTRVPAGAQIDLDIGAVFFDGTRITSDDSSSTESKYTISRVEISGIPQNLTMYGQSAGLVAKVYYTNGRTALCGNGTGEEPVTWTSSHPDIIAIDNYGDAKMIRQVTAEIDVTITVTTARAAGSGVPATDSKVIRLSNQYVDNYNYLNVSPSVLRMILGYVEELNRFNVSLRLADVSSSAVSSSSFQSSFAGTWNNAKASQVTDIADDTLTFSTVNSYTASDGYSLVGGKTGVGINFSGVKEGALFPVIFSWTFSGSELTEILGYNLSGRTISANLADTIFDSMRIDFKGADSSWPVIGSGGVKASEAMSAGALSLTSAEGGSGLQADLTAYLANVTVSSASSASGMNTASRTNDGPQIMNGMLIVPDGSGKDSRIYGTMIMAGKSASSQQNTGTNTNTNSNTGAKQGVSGSSGGGGGCETFGAFMLIPAIIFMAKRKK